MGIEERRGFGRVFIKIEGDWAKAYYESEELPLAMIGMWRAELVSHPRIREAMISLTSAAAEIISEVSAGEGWAARGREVFSKWPAGGEGEV